MPAAVLPPPSLTATVGYHFEGAPAWCPGTVKDKRRPHDHQEVSIENIRGREADFSLDKQGFEVGPFQTSVADVEDNAEFKGQYYDDVVAHMKKATGASLVIPVVHIVRRQKFEQVVEDEKELDDDAPVTQPSYNRSVHIDQSYFGAEMVRDNKLANCPDLDAEKLKSSRWGIINLWRPLGNTVTRDNLACCDARTVDEKDLSAVYANLSPALINAKSGYNFAAGSRSEAWEVRANPGSHKWYFASNMTPNEALLIKQYDSKKGIARRTPHTAFGAKEDYGPTRQSIEVRCLCFWEDQPQE